MSKSDLICVGQVAGAHGVKGEVRLKSFTDDPEAIFSYGPLLGDTGETFLQPDKWRQAKAHFVVTGTPRREREDWEALKGTRLFVPKSVLPPVEEDEFYVEDLKGLSVRHADGRKLGKVRSVENFGADDLLDVVAPDGRTSYYLPFTLQGVPEVRLSERLIIATPEEAFLPDALQLSTGNSEPD